MIPVENTHHISRMAAYIKDAYKVVEERTGIKFGADYLWHINNADQSDWYPNSEKAAIALCVFKDYYPDDSVLFASDLQYALNFEGRDLTDDEAYRHLTIKYKIPTEEFYKKLADETWKEKAYYEFALCKQLKVTGFPTVLLQTEESKFYLLSRGFTEYETLKNTINNILLEINY